MAKDLTTIFPKTNGLDFLGYRIWDYKKLVRKSTQKGLRKAIETRNKKN